MDKKQAVIVDIDGTIADVSHRLHHIKDGNRDWDAFYDAMVDDEVIDGAEEIIKTYTAQAREGFDMVHTIFITGRRDSHREQTIKWLTENSELANGSYLLLMRPEGDTRQDFVLKAELYDTQVEPEFKVIAVFEDRPTVVRMWQEKGLNVIPMGNGEEF